MSSFFSKEKQDDSIDIESIVIEDVQFNRNDILICATNGKIYAVHKRDGSRLWSAGFPGSMGTHISVFITDNDTLMVASRGKVICLELMTGKIIWSNKISGFGPREVSIVTTPSRFLKPKKTLPNTIVQNREEDSPPIYEKESEFIERPILIAGTKGKITAFASDTGEPLWNYQSPGGWLNIPVVIVEPPSLEDGRPYQLIYVGSGKHVCCLRALNGELVWTSKVCDAKLFGLGSMTLATPWSSRLAAEAYTAFSQNPSDD